MSICLQILNSNTFSLKWLKETIATKVEDKGDNLQYDRTLILFYIEQNIKRISNSDKNIKR